MSGSSYHLEIRKSRLEVIRTYVDNDGEGQRSTRRPYLMFYGCSTVHRYEPVPEHLESDIPFTIFQPVGKIDLLRPSFVFDAVFYSMSFNFIPNAENRVIFFSDLSALATSQAIVRFARVFNAMRNPQPMMHFLVGGFQSNVPIKLSTVDIVHQQPITFVNHSIIEH